LQDRIESGRPTLAICLGMQLLAEASDESTGVQGLGVISGRAERFGADVRTPQFGWNTVQPSESFGFADAGYAYYANSYRIVKAPEGWAPAWSDHGGRFVAALRRGRVLACQFHPELSGTWGLGLLGAWSETINADNLESVSC
jgi:glutamine amidotransferase